MGTTETEEIVVLIGNERDGAFIVHPPKRIRPCLRTWTPEGCEPQAFTSRASLASLRATFTKRDGIWHLGVNAIGELKCTKRVTDPKGHQWRLQRPTGSASIPSPSKRQAMKACYILFPQNTTLITYSIQVPEHL